METKPKAYSYIRISSAGQIQGDGLRRQLEQAKEYAASHGLELDDKLKDVGSGYHGKHVKFGALGGFIDLVKSGSIPKGSYLIVESLDRLSREAVIDAQMQLLMLLKAGIIVVTLIDGQVYDENKDFTQLIISLTIMSRAHDESATKSFRAKERIKQRKTEALAGKSTYNRNIVGWIDQARKAGTDEWAYTVNHHGPTIQRIFELADDGVGTHTIARMLNKSKTPVLRRGINPREQWKDAAITRILKDETVLGTLTLFEEVNGERAIMGQPIPNYYPAVISSELFWRVSRNRPKVPHAGRKGVRFANLFARNTACAACGRVLKMYYGGRTQHRRSYYGCNQRHIAGTECDTPIKMFPYDELENAILDYVREFHHDATLSLNTAGVTREKRMDTITALEAKIIDLEAQKENLFNFAALTRDHAGQVEIANRMHALRVQIEQSKSLIDEQKKQLAEFDDQQSALISVSEKIGNERKLWSSSDDDVVFQSRSRVSQALRKFVSRVEVDFLQQIATVWVAGDLREYRFDRQGQIIARYVHDEKYAFRGTEHKVHKNADGTPAWIEQRSREPLTAEDIAETVRNFGGDEKQVNDAIDAAKHILEASAIKLRKNKPIPNPSNPRLNDPETIAIKAKRRAAVKSKAL